MRKVRFLHSLLCPFESLAIVLICCLKVLSACRLHRRVIYTFNSLELNFLVQGTASTHQHVWNSIVRFLASSLVDSASDALSRAHLLAYGAELGAWLNVIPNASLGL